MSGFVPATYIGWARLGEISGETLLGKVILRHKWKVTQKARCIFSWKAPLIVPKVVLLYSVTNHICVQGFRGMQSNISVLWSQPRNMTHMAILYTRQWETVTIQSRALRCINTPRPCESRSGKIIINQRTTNMPTRPLSDPTTNKAYSIHTPSPQYTVSCLWMTGGRWWTCTPENCNHSNPSPCSTTSHLCRNT